MIDKLVPFSRRRRISRYAHKVQVQSIIGMIQKTFKWLSIARTWKPDWISKISLEGVEQLESPRRFTSRELSAIIEYSPENKIHFWMKK